MPSDGWNQVSSFRPAMRSRYHQTTSSAVVTPGLMTSPDSPSAMIACAVRTISGYTAISAGIRVSSQPIASLSPGTMRLRNSGLSALTTPSRWLAVSPSAKAEIGETFNAIFFGLRAAMTSASAFHWSGCSSGFHTGANNPPRP